MKRFLFTIAMMAAAISSSAAHVYPTNPQPTQGAFFGQMSRDVWMQTNFVSGAFVALQKDNFSERLTAATIGNRQSTVRGFCSLANGSVFSASGNCSHAEGNTTAAEGYASHADGKRARAKGYISYVWQGVDTDDWYDSNGNGTFNLNPVGGTSGFYIGSLNLPTILNNEIATYDSTTLNTTAATNSVVGRIKALEQGGGGETVKAYPLFIINLNPGSSETTWTDFELKGSTNNFATADGHELVFWGASADNETAGTETHDWCRIFVSGKPGVEDTRKWVRIKNFADLGTWVPKQVAILICPSDSSSFRRGQGTDWCKNNNDELIWTYLRFSANGKEVDSQIGSDSAKWREVEPVRWLSKLPDWAKQSD